MLGLFTVVIEIPAGIVAVTALAIITVRVFRRMRHRRWAELATGPRLALLAFVPDNGEEGQQGLVAIPDDAWCAVEPAALALLGKLRGEALLRGLRAAFDTEAESREMVGVGVDR